MRAFPLLSLLVCLLAPCVQAETHVFISLAGTRLEAEITSVAGDNVTLKRKSDDQTLVVNLKTLCKEDGAYIDHWKDQHPDQVSASAAAAAAAPAQKYRIVCKTLFDKNKRGFSDKEYLVTYSFNLSNQEAKRDLQDGKGLAITLGKSASESSGDLIVLQKLEFDVNIPAQSKMVYSTKPVILTFNQNGPPPHGVKNYGYVLIIRDAAGNVTFVEASPDISSKFIPDILAIGQAPCVIDQNFKPKPNADIPSSYMRL